MQQQLAVAARLVVVAVALLEWGDMGVDQPRLAPLDARVGIGQVRLAGTDALDLGAGQDEARLERIGDGVVVARLAIERDGLGHFGLLGLGCVSPDTRTPAHGGPATRGCLHHHPVSAQASVSREVVQLNDLTLHITSFRSRRRLSRSRHGRQCR